MSHPSKDAGQRLIDLHVEMKKLCMEARIPESRYDRMLDYPERLEKFEQFRIGPYEQAHKIKSLQSEELWNLYKLFPTRTLEEVRLLRKAFSDMRRVFREIIPDDQAAGIQEGAF